MRESQKALIAARMSGGRIDKNGNAPFGASFTQVEAATKMGVSRRHVQRGAELLREAPPDLIMAVELGKMCLSEALKQCKPPKKPDTESMKESVREGTARVRNAFDAIKQATKATGIAVTKSTSEGDKEKAFAAQEKLMRGEGVAPPMQSDPDIPPPPTTKPKDEEFRERMLSGEFDGKKWKRNIAEIQSIIASIERLPHLYHECFELMQRLEQEAFLNMCVGVLIDAVKNVKSRVQRDEKTDFTEVKKIVTDIVADNFPDIENDFGVGGNREMNEHLKDKFIGECDEAVKAAEQIRSKLMCKHSPS